ncbi:glycoside hydrolase family 16 protein [Mrakia frigida]|uniref:glycoside hydrolase family 16 protein n=1 Tax=Mrakia frigida TaxID=29902 RepID=UPI003FCC0653
MNLGCLAVIILALLMLFAGYPIYTEFSKRTSTTLGAFNLGGINASGQVPQMISMFDLIDKDTPEEAYSIVADNGETWELMFSDEFNQDGRTFYPGDDPYWESIDLHAWGTNDLEWYDHRQLSTKDGKLVLELAEIPKNNLDYLGASLQSWNKFCFSGGGRLEASIQLPGRARVYGLWPAFWTMGNLGRVGYGGTLDGLWPYSYDSCDVGTLPNQTLNGEPAIALTSGNSEDFNFELSYMPGQRLSRCTCPDDETHPGPKHPDGTWVGRAAPEIDVIEAQTNAESRIGEVSLSVQWAPFNPRYEWLNATYMDIVDPELAYLNTYQGGVYQQSGSVIGITNQDCYETTSAGLEGGCFARYAYEYQTGSDGYIKWFNDDVLSWVFSDGGMGPNEEAGISNRPIAEEPMYILFNLAISRNFGPIDLEGLADLWPVHMSVDYVRFYQDPSRKDIGCDPDHHPTAAYIERYRDAYYDPNITTWDQVRSSPLLSLIN